MRLAILAAAAVALATPALAQPGPPPSYRDRDNYANSAELRAAAALLANIGFREEACMIALRDPYMRRLAPITPEHCRRLDDDRRGPFVPRR